MTKGEQIRDFVPIETVASTFTQVTIEQELREGSPYVANVGSGEKSSVFQFSDFWWKKLAVKGSLRAGAIPYRANEVMKFVPSLEGAYL